MSRAGVSDRAFGKWWVIRRSVYFLYVSQLIFAFIPFAKGNTEALTIPGEEDLSREEAKRGGSDQGREVFLADTMPRFSRRTMDHMLRFTRSRPVDHMLRFTRGNSDDEYMLRFARGGSDDDHHMLRFTRGGSGDDHHMLRFTRSRGDDDDHHMLRFTRSRGDDDDHHMLRFTRGDEDHMLRFTRSRGDDDEHHMLRFTRGDEDHMLRYSRGEAGSPDISRPRRSEKAHDIPLDLHMLRFSKRNDDNHMLRYSRKAPMESGRGGGEVDPGNEPAFSRFTRKIMDSMRPRLVRQDDHLLRFA